jgi:hypothetical protein
MNRRPEKSSIGSSDATFFSGTASLMPWAIYTPLLTHLRLLDCVEVQRSSRHIEVHIQSIQVLIWSSIDLNMLSVCA